MFWESRGGRDRTAAEQAARMEDLKPELQAPSVPVAGTQSSLADWPLPRKPLRVCFAPLAQSRPRSRISPPENKDDLCFPSEREKNRTCQKETTRVCPGAIPALAGNFPPDV